VTARSINDRVRDGLVDSVQHILIDVGYTQSDYDNRNLYLKFRSSNTQKLNVSSFQSEYDIVTMKKTSSHPGREAGIHFTGMYSTIGGSHPWRLDPCILQG